MAEDRMADGEIAKGPCEGDLLSVVHFLIAEDDDVMEQPCRVDFGKSRVV